MHTRTRICLHGIAEGVLAGPQHARTGTIRLRVLQGGFGTVAEPLVRVSGTDRVAQDGRRLPLRGTFAELAEAAGVTFTVPDIYPDHAPVAPDDPVEVEVGEAARLAAWWERGRQGLVAFAPGQQPVLWPEHFDLAVEVAEVTYGVSAGDSTCEQPYAYVAPWARDHLDAAFWNAPFGALRTIEEMPTPDALAHFFRLGREQAATAGRDEAAVRREPAGADPA
jgi:hypothetical protein